MITTIPPGFECDTPIMLQIGYTLPKSGSIDFDELRKILNPFNNEQLCIINVSGEISPVSQAEMIELLSK